MLVLLAIACDHPSGTLIPHDSGATGCEGYDWDTVGAPFLFTWCTPCHATTSEDRHDAPATVDFETLERARTWAARIEQRAIVDRTMPPSGGPLEPEIAAFATWLDCGLPE